MNSKYIYTTFRTGLILYIFLISNISLAGSYQSEIGLVHSSISIDPNDKTSTSVLAGVFYLSPIDVDGPFAEAAFISKASYVAAVVGRSQTDLLGANFDGDIYLLGFEYRLTGTNVVLGASYYNKSLSALGYVDYDIDTTTLDIHMFLNDRTLIGLSYESGKNSLTGFSDLDISETAISSKHLINAINVEARYASYNYDDGFTSETNTTINVRGDYYIDNTLSIGAGLEENTGDIASHEGSTVSINVVKFITETTSFELAYDQFSADTGDDSNTVYFSFSGRF